MNKTIVITLAVAVIGAGAGFFGGMQYQKSRMPDGFEKFAGQGRFPQGADQNRRGQGSNQGFVTGKIAAKDDRSITLELGDGGSKIIFYSDSIQLSKMAEAAVGDMAVGQDVSVQGTVNADGSISAQSIQLRPAQGNPGQAGGVMPSIAE